MDISFGSEEFTNLDAWKEAHKLVLMVYKIVGTFPKHELYILTSQILRAVISITANISEGYGRRYLTEKCNFYYIAASSLSEVKNFLLLSKDLNYVNDENFEDLCNQAIVTSKLLNGLISSTKEKMEKQREFRS